MDNELFKLLEELFGVGNVEIIAPNRLEKTMADMISQKSIFVNFSCKVFNFYNFFKLFSRKKKEKRKIKSLIEGGSKRVPAIFFCKTQQYFAWYNVRNYQSYRIPLSSFLFKYKRFKRKYQPCFSIEILIN